MLHASDEYEALDSGQFWRNVFQHLVQDARGPRSQRKNVLEVRDSPLSKQLRASRQIVVEVTEKVALISNSCCRGRHLSSSKGARVGEGFQGGYWHRRRGIVELPQRAHEHKTVYGLQPWQRCVEERALVHLGPARDSEERAEGAEARALEGGEAAGEVDGELGEETGDGRRPDLRDGVEARLVGLVSRVKGIGECVGSL